MTRMTYILSWLITLFGAVSISLAIWVGLPITDNAVLAQVPVRIGLIVLTLGVLVLRDNLRHRKHKRAAQALEQSLITTRTGDGPIVAARMKEALQRLKDSNGATSLYDLPWYILIGPPGAGKTTALIHSGLEFPGTDTTAVAGFGGTKNCDFWFAREAVMIDTAGRYTTQDSDEKVDKLSWSSFLGQLKSARPNQPINGVVLAFSCEDLMTSGPDALETHAQLVRARLAELHATLKTHIPVYVIFTKADMIAGFRQYFGSFDAERRKVVWGVTFQTKDRHEETHRAVAREFSQLLARLSYEVTDRLNEEVDSATRIAIHGFPEQIALMERNITIFLQRIFGTPQKTRSILRGFYFTSGTQEGTPIDQVLGSLSAQSRAGGMQPAFISGRGRSYFLHDLLKKVIFEERDWVGYDRRLMRRRAIVRGSAKTVIAALCLSAMGIIGYSFWSNASLVREAAQQTQTYKAQATRLLRDPVISDTKTRSLLPALAAVRIIPAGYGNPRPQEVTQRLGLSRRAGLRGAAVQAYSDSLERLLRPRMMLFMEQELAKLIKADRISEAYHALKIYILLAKEQDWRADDVAIQAYFAQAWAQEYSAPGSDADYRAINTHLAAMLELDDRVSPWIKPNKTLVDRVREKAATLPLALQAYSAIRSQAGGLAPLPLTDMLEGANIDAVFQSTDARPLGALSVPGLFTHDGYWNMFKGAVTNAEVQLDRNRWVLGPVDAGAQASEDRATQMAHLPEDLHTLYQQDFAQAWNSMLTKLTLVPLAKDAPEFTTLALMAAPNASPILQLIEAVAAQTDLTSPPTNDTADADDPETGTAQGTGFEQWQTMLEGQGSTRPVDGLLSALAGILSAARLEAGENASIQSLNSGIGSYPAPIQRFVEQIEKAFSPIFAQRALLEMTTALETDITPYCMQNITFGYPFTATSGVGISPKTFAAFFGYDGKMDHFFTTHLQPHTQRTPQGDIVMRDDSLLADTLPKTLLKTFALSGAIKDAFFDAGTNTPRLPINISLAAGSEAVDAVEITIGAETTVLQIGSDPIQLLWTGNAPDISLTLLPASDGGQDSLRFTNTPWAALELMTSGARQTEGALRETTYTIGGRTVTLQFTFNGASAAVPDVIGKLADFTCPFLLE
jgi:type VI secretion system protein ImpL